MSFIPRVRKLHDALTKFEGELVSALFTTYNFDSSYFENNLLPELLKVTSDEIENPKSVAINMLDKLAHTKICVVGDGRVNKKTKKSLYGYDFVPIFSATQHAKIFILQLEKSFRLIIGSANLTADGIHRNREVYVEFELDQDSDDWSIFNDVILFLQEMSADNNGRFDNLLLQWQQQIKTLNGNVKAKNKSVEFIGVNPMLKSSSTSGLSLRSVLDSFLKKHDKNSVAERRVDEIYLLSPFWEEETTSGFENSLLYNEYMKLKGDHPHYPGLYLYFPTNGENIITLFPQKTYTDFANEFKKYPPIIFKNPVLIEIDKKEVNRFPHGKMYYLSNQDSFTLAILGSSNFSPSGFGRRAKGKSNYEANIAIFNDQCDKSIAKQLFPKDVEIDPDKWQKGTFEPTEFEYSVDLENDIFVLSDVVIEKNILSMTALLKNPSDFIYKIGGVKIAPIWQGQKTELKLQDCNGVSVEVIDSDGNAVQDFPILFLDESFDQLKIEVSNDEMINWIEARYLNKKNRPLSMLLVEKSNTKTLRQADLAQINTDDFMMYRVKTFNGLVAKIYDRLSEISNFPKRVEYHLLGKLGLIHCVKEYIFKANQKNDLSIFNFYQTAEVLTSVVSAFEKNQLIQTNLILAEFSKQTLIELEKFDADKSVIGQTTEYTKQLKNLVYDIVNRDLN